MMAYLHQLAVFLGSERYSQHSICLTSDSLLLILYTASGITIWASYFAIGLSLITKRHVIADLNPPALAMYGAFIFLCSLSHACDVLVLFTGVYRLQIAILSATASVSAVTAVYTVLSVWGEMRAEDRGTRDS